MKKVLVIFLFLILINLVSFASASIDLPENCENATIKNMWDSIFKESSDGITIYTSNSTLGGQCEKYFAVKNSEDIYYFLIGIVNEQDFSGFETNVTSIYARYANLTAEGITFVDAISSLADAESALFPTGPTFEYEDESFYEDYINLREANLTIDDADSEFENIFELNAGNWNSNDYLGSVEFRFATNVSNVTHRMYENGALNNNYTYDKFSYFYRLLDISDSTEVVPACVPNWSCGSWSDCVSSSQTRTCSDLNNCNVTTGKPAESQSCTCIPNWVCTSWEPEECPKDEVQTRSCSDSNNCGTLAGKPAESANCEYESGVGEVLFWVLVVVIGVGVVAGAVVFVVYLVKYFRKAKQEDVFDSLESI